MCLCACRRSPRQRVVPRHDSSLSWEWNAVSRLYVHYNWYCVFIMRIDIDCVYCWCYVPGMLCVLCVCTCACGVFHSILTCSSEYIDTLHKSVVRASSVIIKVCTEWRPRKLFVRWSQVIACRQSLSHFFEWLAHDARVCHCLWFWFHEFQNATIECFWTITGFPLPGAPVRVEAVRVACAVAKQGSHGYASGSFGQRYSSFVRWHEQKCCIQATVID